MSTFAAATPRKKSALRSFGRRWRDVWIRAFPLELRTQQGWIVPVRNRSELSVYHHMFVERAYPLERFEETVAGLDEIIVFDVGANVGQFAAVVFDHWRNARVHAFEPQGNLVPRIRELARVNGWDDRVTANWTAVGATNGEAEFFVGSSPLGASLMRDKVAARAVRRTTRVSLTTLDGYAASRSLDAVHVVKLDVEGAELDVLRGAQRVLATTRLLFVELHQGFSTFGEVAALVEPHGLVSLAPPPLADAPWAHVTFVRR